MTTGRSVSPAPEPLPLRRDHELPDPDQLAPPQTLLSDHSTRENGTTSSTVDAELSDLEVSRAARLESDWCSQDIVEEWGLQSFPASDAPANW